jgi:multicomponent Na+:H+ antiporter subunit E|tara:strand:+ start:386 stop:823 length:438 start_codon:yes stop_codon:yes gene_type:complete
MLSGHYTLLQLSLGLLSVLIVTIISSRMNLIIFDQPILQLYFIKFIPYGFWLMIQILKSNIDVCIRILNPKLPINPQLVTVKSTQASNLAKVIYANSITLTPGTISIDLDGSEIEVHSLSETGVDGLKTGVMDKKITNSEANPYV